jgi:SpoIID/LytB domain protein
MPSITENGSGAGGAFAAGEDGLFTGRGIGHGIGMCQLGAADMARRGSSFAQILAHYYPNTKLTAIPAP